MKKEERNYPWYVFYGCDVVIVGVNTDNTYECKKFNNRGLELIRGETATEVLLQILELEEKGIVITKDDVHLCYDDCYAGECNEPGATILCKYVPDVENKQKYINTFVTENYYDTVLEEEEGNEKQERLEYEVELVKEKAYESGCYEISSGVYLMTGEEVLEETKYYDPPEDEDPDYLTDDYNRSDIIPDELYLQTNDGYFDIADDEIIARSID